jgi:hypothetical protein
VSETLESLRASFNRKLRVQGKAEPTRLLYSRSIDPRTPITMRAAA